MAVDAVVQVGPTSAVGGIGDSDLPFSFPIAASVTETAANDHQYEFPVGAGTSFMLTFNVTAVAGTGMTVQILGVDAFGIQHGILTSLAIVAPAMTVMQVGPAIASSGNVKQNNVLPQRIRIRTTHLDASSITYSLAGVLTNG